MILTFIVRGQVIKMSGPRRIVADTVNYLDAQYIFGDEWDGCAKVAYFSCGDNSYAAVLDYNNKIEQGINLGTGTWVMHVVGQIVSDDEVTKRITTDPVSFEVYPAGDEAGEGFPVIEASYSEQILQQATEASMKAQEALDKIESGEVGGGVDFEVGVGLDLTDGVLSVDSASDFNGDNTRPAEAALVQTLVGNVEILLKTI